MSILNGRDLVIPNAVVTKIGITTYAKVLMGYALLADQQKLKWSVSDAANELGINEGILKYTFKSLMKAGHLYKKPENDVEGHMTETRGGLVGEAVFDPERSLAKAKNLDRILQALMTELSRLDERRSETILKIKNTTNEMVSACKEFRVACIAKRSMGSLVNETELSEQVSGPKFLTVSDFASQAGIDMAFVRAEVDAGRLPHLKMPSGQIMIPVEKGNEWLIAATDPATKNHPSPEPTPA